MNQQGAHQFLEALFASATGTTAVHKQAETTGRVFIQGSGAQPFLHVVG